MMCRILISDDEPAIIKGLELAFLKRKEYELQTAPDRETAVSMLNSEPFDFVLTDLLMPDIADGLAVIRTAKSRDYDPVVLVMTGFEIAENIVQAMNAGADDLIIKGFQHGELLFRIENLLRKKDQMTDLTVQNTILKDSLRNEFGDYRIIGQSPHIKNILSIIKKVAEDASSTCLISGPSGSGKELVARVIHAQSARKTFPFVPVNCAAIPENLIESELFGHQKGAFTGAISSRIGKFEQAGKGVIFLDEIGDLPPALQMRLLRVLEEKTFTRVGSNTEIPMKAMILAATNKDLSRMIGEGTFREDLFYRLNVIKIEIGSLCDRREDIVPLSMFYLEKLNRERNKKIRISDAALRKLETCDFPGNVRELRNIIENAFVLSDSGIIEPADLSFSVRSERPEESFPGLFRMPYRDAISRFEFLYFEHLLTKNNFRIGDAAKVAELTSEWFGKKIKQLKLK